MVSVMTLRSVRYVVGVDGGATKTVALVGTEDGRNLGRGESGTSNYHNIGEAAAGKAIKEAVNEAQERAGLSHRKLDLAVVALAAVDSSRDKAAAYRFVRTAKIARRIIVVHDSVAALYAATAGRPGIIVIAGTGCVAAGINKAGEYARAGGWGYLVDDEGSAYDIGRRALLSTFKMLDGRAPRTKIAAMVKRRLSVDKIEDALALIYSNSFDVEDVARLAPLVSKAAPHDEICMGILNNAGVALAELVCAVARRLGMNRDRFAIDLIGGAFKAGRPILGPLRATVRKACPYAQVRHLGIEPAKGSLLLATRSLQGHALKPFL